MKKKDNNIEWKTTRRNASRHNDNRFYTSLDMSIIKKDAANRNGQIKRGEVPDYPNNYISVCGCGVEGCFIHGGWETVSKEEMDEWIERRKQYPHHKPKKPKTKKTDYKVDWKSVEFLDNYLKDRENL